MHIAYGARDQTTDDTGKIHIAFLFPLLNCRRKRLIAGASLEALPVLLKQSVNPDTSESSPEPLSVCGDEWSRLEGLSQRFSMPSGAVTTHLPFLPQSQ